MSIKICIYLLKDYMNLFSNNRLYLKKSEVGTKTISDMKKPVNFTTSKISPALIFLQ